jgi:O-antigen/teichoic acid export membrane protein
MMHRNILANIAGRLWATLSNVIFLPLYIQLLGIDNYSVISFTLVVTGMLMILDMGLSATIAREMARGDINEEDKRRTFCTLEKAYILMLLVCILTGQLFADAIAVHFIKDTPVDRELIALCLKLISCEAGLQICLRFYISAMMGLDRQVEANLFNIAWGTVRNGCVILLLVATPKLEAFFIWQLASTLACLVIARWRLQRTLFSTPSAEPYPFIDRTTLLRIRGFASGVFLIALVAVVNTQLDRLVLSRLLDLEYLGYYNIAVAIGTGMLAIASPFVASIQPRLTLLFSSGEHDNALHIYLNVATLIAILLYPLMAVIGLNAEMVVATWTGNADVARNSAALVPWVIVAYTLLSMQQMPFGVAMANGYTRYNNLLGLLSLIVSVPGYWLMVGRYGAEGAAILFMVIQLGAAFALLALVDHRFIRFGAARTALQLCAFPAALAVALAWLFGAVVPHPGASRLLALLYLGLAYLAVLAGTALVMVRSFDVHWHPSAWDRQ